MFIYSFGEYESDSDTEEQGVYDDMPGLEGEEEEKDEEEEYGVVNERLCITMRALSIKLIQEDHLQRQNIFHTKCYINKKVCLMIIDSGSCTNVVSTMIVEKLGLPTIKHPNPYKLQWLSERGEVRVTSQAKLTFTIGKYTEEVTCDVVPTEAGHLLLGRPWEYDRGAIHDEKSNRYSFTFNNRKITFLPITSAQVYECQVQLKVEFDKKKLATQSREEPKTDLLV
ncbi:hypothetical protein BUMB_04189c [Candidatus Paraburkholderia calva]|nr:hypothetical protein BUMB_04189c [Candidatus Paraburkholderia calva]